MVKDTVFINTPQGISDLVDWVARQDTWIGDLQPPLYIDIEGERLSRHGKVSLLTVLIYPGKGRERPHIIDIHTLGSAAFSIVGRLGKSLKDILESPRILKVFFDVRNDSDALYAHYGIELQGVRDVQLMECASRPTTDRRKFVCGLSKCIQEVLNGRERTQWRLCKEKGETLWNPQKGGSYSVFTIRPLSNEITSYCVGDVQHLPALYHKYRRGTDRWRDLIAEESQKRVSASQTVEYQPHGAGRALSPWSPEQNKMLDSWSTFHTPRDYFSYLSDDDLDGPEGDLWDEGDFERDFWDEDDFKRHFWDEDDLERDFGDEDDFERDFGDDNDFEDWTRAPWQGPPS